MNQLYDNYRWHRQQTDRRLAATALKLARQDIADHKARYPRTDNGAGNWESVNATPLSDADFIRGIDYKSRTERAYYCDDWPAGWRLVGRADEVGSVDHKGWYTEDDGDSGTLAGYVLRLPHGRLVPGTRHTEYDGVTLYPLDSYDDEAECARAADRYAEIAADRERDYQRGWRAGCDAAELERDSAKLRQRILTICADLRIARSSGNMGLFRDLPIKEATQRLCALARANVAELLATIYRNRKERDKLRDEHYGDNDGYRNGYQEG